MDKREKTITIPVPNWANWRTVDKSGVMCFFENKPRADPIYPYVWVSSGGNFMEFGKYDEPTDWTKELHRIE